MIICHCEVVTDLQILEATRQGATTPAQVAALCRAGTGCGGCHLAIAELLRAQGVRAYTAAPQAGACRSDSGAA